MSAVKLETLLVHAWENHPLYRDLWQSAGWTRAPQIEEFARLPLTTKDQLLARQADLWTYPPARYTRLHQTSGTKGTPLRWLDTPESWQWMLGCWRQIYAFAKVDRGDRYFFPFSFGPFLGFWTAFEAALGMGALTIAAGGMSSAARLRLLLDQEATVICCTPTYALHLGQTALDLGIDLKASKVRRLIVAGEPGGSIPATRQRIEELWQARVIDHSGMTEVGPMTVECFEHPGGLHVLEDDFFVEVLDESGQPAAMGELIVTNLGRLGSPVIRYRTGDLVRIDPEPCPCGSRFLRLAGGILGRTDDMVPIRGNNFYPSAMEGVLRRFAEVVEYRVEIDASNPLAELLVQVELREGTPADFAGKLAGVIRDELLFRAEVEVAAPGTLPRFEMKAQRIHKKR